MQTLTPTKLNAAWVLTEALRYLSWDDCPCCGGRVPRLVLEPRPASWGGEVYVADRWVCPDCAREAMVIMEEIYGD